MSGRAVGIDLGTTYSVLAKVNQHGMPEIIPNAEGFRITPSVVLFDEGEVIVGSYARQSAVVYPDQVVEFIKRHMGDPHYRFTYRDQNYTPEQISSFILAKLKHDVELRVGHPIEQAVITVPAYFGDAQRQATLRAGEIAGMEVLQLINEPTAAAFAYGLNHLNRNEKKMILVFDLGGGTFDATLIEIQGRDLCVRATIGDHQLGGKDWDDMLIQYVAEQFQAKHGVDPLENPSAYHDLRQKCVSAKISLTRRPRVNIFYDYQGRILRQNIDRSRFEDLTAGLTRRCRILAEDLLEEVGIHPRDVDTVLLAGGATRMPMVRGMLQDLFHRAPATDINPDECVAIGAALTASLESSKRSGTRPPVDVRTYDVASHSLGMVVYRDGALHNSKIITRNTRIPCECTREDYVSTHDGQTSMDLWLVQGESEQPMECTVLGHFEFYGLPPRPAGESQISVTYRYNANGIVEVEAMDLKSGQALAHRMAAGHTTLEDLAQNRAPIHIALLIDCSGSMYGPCIEDARKAAMAFVSRSLQPGRKLALFSFPGGMRCPLVSEEAEVARVLQELSPMGGTPLADALVDARALLKPRAGVQRVFVILTDGHPDDPERTMAEAHRLRAAGARLITVGVGPEVQPRFLESLASSPGDYHFCSESLELEGTFINLATQLSS